MVITTVPKEVKENLSRARAYLKREDAIRSLEAAIIALRGYTGLRIVGNAKFVTEVGIQEYISDVNRHHDIRNFFISRRLTKEPFVQYKPGQEAQLVERLETIVSGMTSAKAQFEKEAEERQRAERATLLKRGLDLLYTKDEKPKGRVVLRRYIDLYGGEAGVIAEIGNHFLKAELPFEAADLFEQAMDKFPNDAKGYVGAVKAYTALGEWDKTETVYLNIIKTFGGHPKTFLNIAKFYMDRRKRDKAYDFAWRAIKGDPSLKEAQEIMDKIDGRY